MIEIPNHSQFVALEKQVESQTIQTIPPRLLQFMPTGLESYCKIFHTIYKDVDLDGELRDWSNYPESNQEYTRLIERTFSPQPNFNAQRIKWKEIANFQQVAFGRHFNLQSFPIWSVKYVYDEDALIDCNTAERLSKALIQSGATQDYYFGHWTYDDNSIGEFTRLYQANLLKDGNLVSAENFLGGTVAYWWAIDHSWYVSKVAERHLYFSYCGASKKIIDAILKDDFLETIETEIDAIA